MGAPAEISFLENTCVPFLRDAQNADGGWGFHPRSQSRAEPTCWALMALIDIGEADESETVLRGVQFLRTAQLPDGSWPTVPGEQAGSWVTSLACWTLHANKASTTAVSAGLRWLCDDWPKDSAPWRRVISKLSGLGSISSMNPSLRGWGWTPGTSSWVEPTSLALLALSATPRDLLPAIAARRQRLAEAMLYDRMCPGGGWNCGNPRIYGVAGEPLVVPTGWALLALLHRPERPENAMSLDWLEHSIAEIHGAGSLALARICLEAYGRKWPAGAPELLDLYGKNKFLQNTHVMAWTCLALNPNRKRSKAVLSRLP